MDYSKIISKIDEQKNDHPISEKLYRYNGLVQAIEFFSQKLNSDQIVDSAFDFVNELLIVDTSAIFVLQGNHYIPKKTKGYFGEILPIKNSAELQNIAKFYGTLLYERAQMERFFQKEMIEAHGITAIIPMIEDDVLFGFITIANKVFSQMNGDDHIISEALMRLINNALENYKRYEEIQKANRELDEKVFNLFAINHSSKALLSELNLDILFNLSVDVFSELTQSAATAFFLYDEKSEQHALKSYKNVYNMDQFILLGLSQKKLARVDINRVIIDMKKEVDAAYFDSLFEEGTEKLKEVKAEYIVLLIRNGKIIGFVTLANTVTGAVYKRSVFELIESMASSTYIAISNAQFFKQVNEQKKVIASKLERVITLNNLMKNINSSLDFETLLDLTMKTFEVSLDVEKAMIGIYHASKNSFVISKTLNINLSKNEIKLNEHWKRVLEGDTVFEAKEEGVSKYTGKKMKEEIGVCPGIAITPIFIEGVDLEMLGVIIIFKHKHLPVIDEESILTTETISGHLAPVMNNLIIIEEQKKLLLPNYVESFKRDLKEVLKECNELHLSLEVIHIMDHQQYVFKENLLLGKLNKKFNKVYPFCNRNIFIIHEGDENIDTKLNSLRNSHEVDIKKYVLGEHFNDYPEFLRLF